MMPITLPATSSSERSRLIPGDYIRRRALDRLYERKAAVEDLIRSLEDYQLANQPRRGECVPFIAPRKCS
jgi:ERCC4-type nuclease